MSPSTSLIIWQIVNILLGISFIAVIYLFIRKRKSKSNKLLLLILFLPFLFCEEIEENKPLDLVSELGINQEYINYDYIDLAKAQTTPIYFSNIAEAKEFIEKGMASGETIASVSFDGEINGAQWLQGTPCDKGIASVTKYNGYGVADYNVTFNYNKSGGNLTASNFKSALTGNTIGVS